MDSAVLPVDVNKGIYAVFEKMHCVVEKIQGAGSAEIFFGQVSAKQDHLGVYSVFSADNDIAVYPGMGNWIMFGFNQVDLAAHAALDPVVTDDDSLAAVFDVVAV